MKVQCDVCEKAVATLICCADEAALCSACDARIHAANKLAGKHERVPLIPPPALFSKQLAQVTSEVQQDDVLIEQEATAASNSIQRCDICQEKTASFFCLEDRALLCRDCDVSIHMANALAAKHRRFLLTGIRVGYAAIPTVDAATTATTTTPSTSSSYSQDKPLSSPPPPPPPPPRRPASCSSSSAAARSLLHHMSSSTNGTAPAKPKIPAAAGAAANSSAVPLMKVSGTSVVSDNHGRRRWFDATNQLQNIKWKSDTASRVPQCTNLLKSTPGLSIQMRLSAGRPFIAPVLSTVPAENNHHNNSSSSSNNIKRNSNNHSPSNNTGRTSYNSSTITSAAGSSLNNNTTVRSRPAADHSPPSSNFKKRRSSSSISQYFTEGIPGWKLDEVLLEDLAEPDDFGGAKVDRMSWGSDLFDTDLQQQGDQEDNTAEMRELLMMNMQEGSPPGYYYSSGNEAEVPDMMMNITQQQLLPDESLMMAGLLKSPSPPTASGLSRGKPIHRHRLHHHDHSISVLEDSLVPDISSRSHPLKRVRNWLDPT